MDRSFAEGEKEFARNYASIGKKWLNGIVISVAQCSLKVKLTSSLVIHRHFDQICKGSADVTPGDTELIADCDAYTYLPVNNDDPETTLLLAGSPEVLATEQLPQNRRYPLRTCKAPDCLNL